MEEKLTCLTLDGSVVLVGMGLSNGGLLGEADTTDEHDSSEGTENDDEGDEGTNDTGDGLGDARAAAGAVAVGVGARVGGGAVGSALAVVVAAELAPVVVVLNGELAHAGLEVVPGEGGLVLAKEWERGEGVGGGGAVGEEEADADVLGGGLGLGGVGDELKGHGGGVVDDAVKVLGGGGELGEAEEGHEGAVGAKLGVEARAGSGLVNDGLQRGEDLAGQDGAGNGADGRGLVVGQVPFQVRGEGEEAVVGGVVDDVGVVVDFAYVDVVKDCETVQVSNLGTLQQVKE